MDQTLKKTITLSFDDYRHYNIQHMTGWSKVIRIILFLAIPAALILTTSGIFFAVRNELRILMIPAAALTAVLFLAYLTIGLSILRLKSFYKENTAAREEQQYEFTPDGFTVHSKRGETRLPWNKLYGIKESERIIVLYISRQQGFVLPKSSFSAEELSKLRLFSHGQLH